VVALGVLSIIKLQKRSVSSECDTALSPKFVEFRTRIWEEVIGFPRFFIIAFLVVGFLAGMIGKMFLDRNEIYIAVFITLLIALGIASRFCSVSISFNPKERSISGCCFKKPLLLANISSFEIPGEPGYMVIGSRASVAQFGIAQLFISLLKPAELNIYCTDGKEHNILFPTKSAAKRFFIWLQQV
jgi:hypothetical protein